MASVPVPHRSRLTTTTTFDHFLAFMAILETIRTRSVKYFVVTPRILMQSPGVVGGAPIRALSLDTSPPIRDAQVTFIYHTTGATRSRVVKKDQLESVKDPAQAGTSD